MIRLFTVFCKQNFKILPAKQLFLSAMEEYLNINVPEVDGQWAIFMDQGEGYIRMQNDTNATGTFHYDLREYTGWGGVHPIKLRLHAITDGATMGFDWVEIADHQ